jgi:hypothetical protein
MKKHETKFALQDYAVIISTENSSIKFNNNKVTNLLRHDTAQNHRIIHKVV